jgi:hypothetical protein
MMRKLILTAMIATGTAAGLTTTPASASAQPPFPGRHEPHGPGIPDRDRDHDRNRDRHDYAGLVRHHGHWDRYRMYDDRDEAQRAVWRLERQGQDERQAITDAIGTTSESRQSSLTGGLNFGVHYRHPRQLWYLREQFEVAVEGAALVFGDPEAGPRRGR